MNEPNKIELLKKAIIGAETNIKMAETLLTQLEEETTGKKVVSVTPPKKEPSSVPKTDNPKDETVITGVFDGVYLVQDTGEKIEVDKDYLARSFIVFGDTLKCSKEQDGLVFKQIKRVKRNRILGELVKKGDGFIVKTDKEEYQVLSEAVNFHKLQEHDKVIILIPAVGSSLWGTIEKKDFFLRLKR